MKTIKDSSTKDLLILLLNIIEEQNRTIKEFYTENQQLKDEINKLKGEQGKPDIKSKKVSANISSEKERNKVNAENKTKEHTKPPVIIDNEEILEMDKILLPEDAYFLRYDELISQDIRLVRCNTKYKFAVYYSPSKHKTYRVEIPKEYSGYFSSNLKSLAHILTHACDVTNSKLLQLFRTSGISISEGSLTNILLENTGLFVNEKRDILKAGLSHSYCGLDSTRTNEQGKNLSTQIICNEYFTIFSSMPSKSRIDILAALQGEPENGILYCYNETSRKLLDQFSVSVSDKNKLSKLFNTANNNPITRIELDKIIQGHIPELKAKKNMYMRVCESLAIGYYQEQWEYPPLKYLLSDDAPEYQKIAILKQALCWVHDARAYKKLMPFIEIHKQILDDFMQEYWAFYKCLLIYKINPYQSLKDELDTIFDNLFTTKTNYFELNQRIKKTYANKEKLLAVLINPSLPLHNNASELGARRVVIKRDISLHTVCRVGTKNKDAVMSIIETAKKLKVNFINYLSDRISGNFSMPSLSQLIYNINTS